MLSETQAGYIPLVFMVVIVNRGYGEKLSALMTEQVGARYNLLTYGLGTADSKMLAYLGIGDKEKDVLYSIMPYGLSRRILDKLNDKSILNMPGRGIAFTIPLNEAVNRVSDERWNAYIQEKGGTTVEQSHEYDLIVAITNQGYAEEVMETAKAAGARGGTIMKARGVGAKEDKFFGVTITPEKDMLYILTKKETRSQIMAAISEQKGIKTDAKTIVFSLPVNGVAGLSLD